MASQLMNRDVKEEKKGITQYTHDRHQFWTIPASHTCSGYMDPMRTLLDKSTHQGTGLLLVGSLMGENPRILSSNMYDKAVNRMFGTQVVCGAFC